MSPHMAPSGGWGMSALPPLSGDKQTSGERAPNDGSGLVEVRRRIDHATETGP
jgi:hypothetical protein